MTQLYKIPQSVLVIIHTKELDVLLIARADRAGFWQSVTGSKDTLDELPSETAKREVAEETGIQIDGVTVTLCDWNYSNTYEIYPTWRHRYAPGVTHNIEHVFSLQVPSTNIPITLSPREHLQFVWLPYQKAAQQCFSASNTEAILRLPDFVQR